jgi:hypothetical protein
LEVDVAGSEVVEEEEEEEEEEDEEETVDDVATSLFTNNEIGDITSRDSSDPQCDSSEITDSSQFSTRSGINFLDSAEDCNFIANDEE